jgi:uncharacterized protein
MKCPNDDSVLVMSERSGIEIDFCPTCRGVWLDRGELDKIIERSFLAPVAGPTVPSPTHNQMPPQSQPPREYQGDRDRDSGNKYGADRYGTGSYGTGQDQYGRKRKKESWLSELFD